MSSAISTILLADFIMSLDNVLGVAGASEGNLGLLIFGLILSIEGRRRPAHIDLIGRNLR